MASRFWRIVALGAAPAVVWASASGLAACVGNDPSTTATATDASDATAVTDARPGDTDDVVTQTSDTGVPVLASCKKLYEAGFTTDGVYVIDPDGPGGTQAFEVRCEMSTEGGGWTLAAIVAETDNAGWSALATWRETQPFGPSPHEVADVDMKFPGWSSVPATQIRFSAGGSNKVSDVRTTFTLAELFGSGALIELSGVVTGAAWYDDVNAQTSFFALIQNPPTTDTKNRGDRNACVLAMEYDEFMAGQDDQVSGYGCIGVDGGNFCASGSCGDVVREKTLRVYVR